MNLDEVDLFPVQIKVKEKLSYKRNDCTFLAPASLPGIVDKCLVSEAQSPQLPIGSYLSTLNASNALLQVVSVFWHPISGHVRQKIYCLRILQDLTLEPGNIELSIKKEGYSLSWITLSDKGAAGVRQDASGPLIPEYIARELPLSISQGHVLPDDPQLLKALLVKLALEERIDLIFSSGGTGVTSRDITPETTQAILERRLPGFEQAMQAASLAKTKHAMLSRAVAGVLGRSLIINLPGSPKAVREHLEIVLPALKHTLEKINDDPGECGSI